MLTLTRNKGEKLVISNGSNITVTILGIKQQQVKLGIEAPKEISIYRKEIYPQPELLEKQPQRDNKEQS